MLLSKNDFESGLQQDLQQIPHFKPPAVGVGGIVPVVGQAGPIGAKDNLFGPPQNLGAGFGMIPTSHEQPG